MRLLLLNHNLRGRGTWHRAWQLGREMTRRGHRVTLWTAAPHHFYRPVSELCEGVRIVETPSWAPLAGADDGWGPLDILYRSGRILTQPFDLCYAFAHPPNVGWPAWLARRLRRRPLLYDWCDWYEGGIFPKRIAMRRDGLLGQGERPLQERTERWEIAQERRMPHLANRVTVISDFLMDQCRAMGLREEQLMLLPNGADLDKIRPLEPIPCREALGLRPEGLYLSYVANYHPDQELLLRGLAQAAQEHPGLRLIKTGPPLAESLVRDLALDDRIIDLGRVADDQLPLVLGAGDLALLPLEDNASNHARVPFKFTDYLAAGRPIATCQVGDLVRWFDNDPGCAEAIGIASQPTIEGFGEAIAGLLRLEEPRRREMGRAARRLAEAEFSWHVLAAKLESFIQTWLAT